MAKNLLKKAFTLVELIIVIAIVAILAVISFLWLNKWLGNARDASRKGNLANLDKALQIYLTEKTTLPKPDNNTMLYASGIDYIIGYQGYFGETARDTIGNIDKAPKNGNNYFTYYVNNDLKKYQLMAYMENPVAYNPNTANAEDYAQRYIYVRGDKLGILTDSDKNPLQNFGGTGFNVLSGENNYTSYFDNSTNASGTGKQLFTHYYNQTKSLLQNTGFAQYDDNLVFYSNMEDLDGSLLKDLSQNGNNGACYSGINPLDCGAAGGPEILDGEIKFDGIDDNIYLGALNGYDSKFGTISFRIKVNKIITSLVGVGWNFYCNYLDADNRFRIYINKSSNRGIFYSKKDGIPLGNNFTNDYIEDNVSYLITLTYSQTKGKYNIYVNDEFQNSFDFFELPINNHYIGIMKRTTFTDPFNGTIDEVRIYNRALSDDEVKALYTATN